MATGRGAKAPITPFDIFTTWGHRARIDAESVQHARRLFLGEEWPPGVPPAPKPAQVTIPNSGGRTEVTPEWQHWYNEQFLPQRAKYPVLAWAHGECMSSVHPAGERSCPGGYNTSTERWVECSICGSSIGESDHGKETQ